MAFENQIKQTKKIDIEKIACIADLCMYLEILQKFQEPKFENICCPWTHLYLYGTAMSQYAHNGKLLI